MRMMKLSFDSIRQSVFFFLILILILFSEFFFFFFFFFFLAFAARGANVAADAHRALNREDLTDLHRLEIALKSTVF